MQYAKPPALVSSDKSLQKKQVHFYRGQYALILGRAHIVVTQGVRLFVLCLFVAFICFAVLAPDPSR